MTTIYSTGNSHKKLEYRIAGNQFEIEQALSLRYQVFNQEMGKGITESHLTQKDRDEYDYYCDHLIVVDTSKNDLVVGTYRILRETVAKKSSGFYSETEFDLSPLDKLEGEKAELGRSCVHPDYRDGSVILLLWKGISWYLKTRNIRFLLGCGSLYTNNPYEVSLAFGWLREKKYIGSAEYFVNTKSDFVLHGFNPEMPLHDPFEASNHVPALIKGYIRAGSKICSGPAIDLEFGTTDLFILFDTHDIDRRLGKRYQI